MQFLRRAAATPVVLVLAIAGALGFGMGLHAATWHWAVELGQIQAGLVIYNEPSQLALDASRMWSLLHVFTAGLLRLGLSERTVCALLSGLLGSLWFQGLALTIFAVSRNVGLAIAGTLIVIAGGATDFGVTYPISGLANPNSYGAIGLAVALVVIGLFGSGNFKSASFILGLSLGIHPPIGATLIAAAGLAALLAGREDRQQWRSTLLPFVAGVSAAGLTYLATHLHVPLAASPAADAYLRAYIERWDSHRQPIRWTAPGFWLNVLVALAALCGLRSLPDERAATRRNWFRFVLAAEITSIGLSLFTLVPPDRLPAPLLSLMPGRLLNIGVAAAAAIVFGIISLLRPASLRNGLLWFFGAGVLLGSQSLLWSVLGHAGLYSLALREGLFLLLVGGGLVVLLLVRRGLFAHEMTGSINVRWLLGISAAAAGLIGLATSALPQSSAPLKDRGDDVVWSAAGEGSGTLVTSADLWLVQLRTRRPVLLEGGTLDTLPYIKDGAGTISQIMQDIYGLDLLQSPPTGLHHAAFIPKIGTREVWERRTDREWSELGRRYRFSQVLAYADWNLALPVRAHGSSVALFDVATSQSASAR